MSFYDDPIFFPLSLGVALIAGIIGAFEKPIRPFGCFATLVFMVLLFYKTPIQAASIVLFLVLSTIASFWLLRKSTSKLRFVIALIATLAPLVVFKITETTHLNLLGFIGISYLTFKAVQTVIEIHDGLIKQMSLVDYLYFLLFFPTIISGPIDRSRRFYDDLHTTLSRHDYGLLFCKGLLLFGAGFIYKEVFGTFAHSFATIGPLPNDIVSQAEWLYNIAAQIKDAWAYSFYLFFDFAGYSLMAMGLSYCFGVKTPRNFKAPFAALNIKDFWNRWHITLSFWLRDFVFMRFVRFSLKHKWFNKNRLAISETGYILNMTLMGMWHGLSVSYIAYGVYHGVLLAVTELWQRTAFHKKHKNAWWYKFITWGFTINLVVFGFALFSDQIAQVMKGLLKL